MLGTQMSAFLLSDPPDRPPHPLAPLLFWGQADTVAAAAPGTSGHPHCAWCCGSWELEGSSLLAAMVVAALGPAIRLCVGQAALAPSAGGPLFPSPGDCGRARPSAIDRTLFPRTRPPCSLAARLSVPAGHVAQGQDTAFLRQRACRPVGTQTASARSSLSQRTRWVSMLSLNFHLGSKALTPRPEVACLPGTGKSPNSSEGGEHCHLNRCFYISLRARIPAQIWSEPGWPCRVLLVQMVKRRPLHPGSQRSCLGLGGALPRGHARDGRKHPFKP